MMAGAGIFARAEAGRVGPFLGTAVSNLAGSWQQPPYLKPGQRTMIPASSAAVTRFISHLLPAHTTAVTVIMEAAVVQ